MAERAIDAGPAIGPQVLVFAPTGRDQPLILRLLERHDLACAGCESQADLCQAVQDGGGPFIVTEEGLTDGGAEKLMRLLDEQPRWSEVPVILLTRRHGYGRDIKTLTGQRGVRWLWRPIASQSLLGMVRIAIEARRRQKEVGMLLEKLHAANADLNRRARQLRDLSRAVMEAEDRERKRLAVILHDDLQQLLAGANLQMGAASHHIGDNEKLRTVWNRVSAMLGEAQRTSRNLSHELFPAVLHEAELGQMLRWVSENARTIFGLDVDLSIESELEPVSPDVVRFLYRAVRELLCNTGKHADVTRMRITAGREADRIVLVVSDRGRGFDPDQLETADPHNGIGLPFMQERIEWLGGKMQIESRIGEGSRFTLAVPATDGQAIQEAPRLETATKTPSPPASAG